MDRMVRRLSLLFLTLFLLLGVPLRAQLDPRLQAGKTDFLDLYQQSSSVAAKPEIITVFDYSRSMASLMFHPLYVNKDIDDKDDYRYMKFVLTNSNTGAAPNNVWKITATSDGCNAATATWTVTVPATGSPTWVHSNDPQTIGCNSTSTSTAGNVTLGAYASAMSSAIAKINLIPVSTTTAHTNYQLAATPYSNSGIQGTGQTYAPYTMTTSSGATTLPTITISASAGGATGPWAPGTVLTLTVYMKHAMAEGEDVGDKMISWNGGAGSAVWSEITTNQVYKSVATYTIPDFVPVTTTAKPTQLKAIDVTGTGVTGSGTNSGTVPATGPVTFKTSYVLNGSSSTKVTWSISPGSQSGGCSNPISVTSTASSGTIGTANTATWTIPAYCGTTGTASIPNSYVTVTLNAAAGASYTGAFAYPGNLSATTKDATGYEALRKPDGSAVTITDATNASTASGLYGSLGGALDVRNWIRAASHVRFKNGSRTIDIPIPWEIMDRNTSTGSPLASSTILDSVVKKTTTNGVTTTTTYGSGLYIEPDQCYKLNLGLGNVFTSDTAGSNLSNSNQTTAYLWTTVYRPAYIAWLFNGVYSSTAGNSYYNASYSATSPYIVFDAQTANKVLGQTAGNLSWGQGFGPTGSSWGNIQVPLWNVDGTYNSTVARDASAYKIPAVTRAQAMKQAAIKTWIANQADVFWAFRCLDPLTEAAGGAATTIDNNSKTTLSANVATTTHTDGVDSGWTVLNNTTAQGINSTSGNSVTGMKRIASLFAIGETPLTYAMARALAQYTDPNSVFNSVVGTDVSQCANSFLILFTDGVDNNAQTGFNNANATAPYLTGSGATLGLNAQAGNQAIITTPTQIRRSGAAWNMFTLAGVGAHMADPSLGTVGVDFLAPLNPGTSTKTDTPDNFLPYAIAQRNFVPYAKPHRVTTMTVGVSLGGQYTDATSPKRSLFLAAVMGDPNTTTGTLSGFRSFTPPIRHVPENGTIDVQNDWIPDPGDPSSYPDFGKKKDGAVYFFDATDPDKLSDSLKYALALAISAGGNNATANPNLPYIGASFGKEVYLGKFQTPKAGGVVWPGDLLMFGTRAVNGIFNIIDKNGNIMTTADASSAQWSASDALLNRRLWSARKLFTRLPGNATNPELGLKPFTDLGTDYTNSATLDNTSGLKNVVAIPAVTAGGPEQIAIIQNAAGANLTGTKDGTGRPNTNRLNIMGDVINSAPAAQEYKFSDSTISTGIAASTALSGVSGNRFRLLLVGTNQGWLHAFGEVTKAATVVDGTGTSQEIVTGKVDELWSFMPTDFLANLNYAYGANAGSSKHRFMVDGSPSIYFLDLPPSTGGTGNGVLDYGTTPAVSERAIAIVGLGKGGRSYYAIDVRDPFHPALKWSLVPDEAAIFPDARNLSTLSTAALRTIIGNMGYSSCTPGIGRVAFTHAGSTKFRDAVFLGGGFSLPEVDHNFPVYPSPPVGQNTPLGRSVLALDAYTGEVLSAVTLPAGTGPVSDGVVPFEFFLNSGMAQRAYFLDRTGGLWAWGSKATPASSDPTYATFNGYRVDTSDLAKWTVDGTTSTAAGLRKVAQDGTGKDAVYSTLPAPFRLGTFPGAGKDGAVTPAAVGIAMVSGDRHNPLDFQYAAGAMPDHHRLTVVFDRQDSRRWGVDSQTGPDTGITDSMLRNFTGNTVNSLDPNPCTQSVWRDITPGCADFYLAPASGDPFFGYFVNFPSATGGFVSKGINTPMVVAGSLFYTYFTPQTADPCTGGSGVSESNLIADVMSPVVTDNRANIPTTSGIKFEWTGVASNYFAFGTRGVFQGGTVPVVNPPPGGATTVPVMKTILGKASERFPKARVWRTVQ